MNKCRYLPAYLLNTSYKANGSTSYVHYRTMSTTYRTTDTMVHTASRTIIGRDRSEINDRGSSSTKSSRNDFLFSKASKPTNVTNYAHSERESGQWNTSQKNERGDKNTRNVLEIKRSKTAYTKCNTEDTAYSTDNKEAYMKRKAIGEIINKYRNQLKMIQMPQSKHMDTTGNEKEGKLETEKEGENQGRQSNEEVNKYKQVQLDAQFKKGGTASFQKYPVYEAFEKTELAGTVTTNSKTNQEYANPYFHEKWGNNFNTKMGTDKKGEITYESIQESHPCNGNTNFSTIEKEKEAFAKDGKHHEGEERNRLNEKRRFDLLDGHHKEYDSSVPIHQHKRVNTYTGTETEIECKQEKFLKMQTGIGSVMEENQEQMEREKSKQKMTDENNKDDIFQFRRFLNDSIAFDEFKIKDKFKEIEQIEQAIRAKNLLAPVVKKSGKEQTCTVENVDQKMRLEEQTKNKCHFNKIDENNSNITCDTQEENRNRILHNGKYEKTSPIESFTEKMEEKKNMLLNDVDDTSRNHSGVKEDVKWENRREDISANAVRINSERQKVEVDTSLIGTVHRKKPRTEKYVHTNSKINDDNECSIYNDSANAIRKVNSTSAINKEMEEYMHSKYCLSPVKPRFLVEEFSTKMYERQLEAKYKDQPQLKRSPITHETYTKNSIRDRKSIASSVEMNKENEHDFETLECIRNLENISSKGEDDKKEREEKSCYDTKVKIRNCYKLSERNSKRDNRKNSKDQNSATLSTQNFRLSTFSTEEKKNEKEETARIEGVRNSIEGNDIENKKGQMLPEKEENDVVKEGISRRKSNDARVPCKEKIKTLAKKREPSFLFSNNFTQDRKKERTIKTVYTEEPRKMDFPKIRKIDDMRTLPTKEKDETINGVVEKCSLNKENEMQQYLVSKMYHMKSSCKENADGGNHELLKPENIYEYKNFREQNEKRMWKQQNENDYRFKKRELLNRSIQAQIQMNTDAPLTKSMDVPLAHNSHFKLDNMLNKTYNEIANDRKAQFLKNSTLREPNISEKYETDYKMLEKLRTDLELRRKQQNTLFFSANCKSQRNNNLRDTNISSILSVTHIGPSNTLPPKKRNSSIITDKVFDEDDNEKEEEKGNCENLKKGYYIKDKQQSIERIQNELNIINGPSEKIKMEDIGENIVRDEINQKRKLYEEKLRKDFAEKIKLRRQLLEQKKEEDQQDECYKKNTTSNDKGVEENGSNKHTNETEKKINIYKSENKNKEKKKKNIIDEYSSDGSYYQQLYKQLYDEECTKKWKNNFYDVSDNLYLQDCSDNFFSNLKKNKCEKTPLLTSSIDLDLISLSKIKFDDFDYNYLNNIKKGDFSEFEQSKCLNSSNSTVISVVKEMHRNILLKKPQLMFSDSSDKETSKCASPIHATTKGNRNVSSIYTERGEKENNILCKLVKNKTKENETNTNWNDSVAEGCVTNDSVSKNHDENKTVAKEVTLFQKQESFPNKTQEEVLCTANKVIETEVPKKKIPINHVTKDIHEVKTNEMSESKKVSYENRNNKGINDMNPTEFGDMKKRSYRNISNEVSELKAMEVSPTSRKRSNSHINNCISEVERDELLISQKRPNRHAGNNENEKKTNAFPPEKQNIKKKSFEEKGVKNDSINFSKLKNAVEQKEISSIKSDMEKKYGKNLNVEKPNLKNNKLEQPNTKKFNGEKVNLGTVATKIPDVRKHTIPNSTPVEKRNEEKLPIQKNCNVKKRTIDKKNGKENCTNIEMIHGKRRSLEIKDVKNYDTVKESDNIGGDAMTVQDLPKRLSNEVFENQEERENSKTTEPKKNMETNALVDKKSNSVNREGNKEEDNLGSVKDSSSSSNKTLPKINILQNEENYIPLDLALNFVMDSQKLKKQVKKEKEPTRHNKKKTFTQWVFEERKKRLKNNLPIDI